jgi:serine protease inhibitor
MSPASSDGIVPFRDYDQEVRRLAVSTRDTINKWRGFETNQPRSRVTPNDSWLRINGRTQLVKTNSYYCEPVWWSAIRRFWTNKITADQFRCRSRKVKTDQIIAD